MTDSKNNKKRSFEWEINLIPLLKEFLKKSWLIVIVGAVFAAAFFGVSKLTIKPTYRCYFTAYVNNQQMKTNDGSLTNSDLMASKELVKTYSEILESRTILKKAADNLGLKNSYEQLRKMVTTEIQNETEIITVYVEHKKPLTAYDLANEIAKISPEYMASIIKGSSMEVIDYPEYSDTRYKPSYVRYALLGLLIGILLVMVILTIRVLSDDTIKGEGEVESRFGVLILGVIPDSNRAETKEYGYKSKYEYGYHQHPSGRRYNSNEKE